MKNLLFAFVLVVATTAGDSGTSEHWDATPYINASNYTPAMTFIGKNNGDLVRCSLEDNTGCKTLHQAGSPIMTMIISGVHIFMGLNNGEILKCHLNKYCSCQSVYWIEYGTSVRSLAVWKGYLLVGLHDGIIYRCELVKDGCSLLHNTGSSVGALIVINNKIYAGLLDGKLKRCSLTVTNHCTEVYTAKGDITGLARIANSMYVLIEDGHLLQDMSIYSKLSSGMGQGMETFNGSLHVISYDTGVYRWVNESSSERYIDQNHVLSLAMAYGTYHLQSQYKYEDIVCKQQINSQQCELVTYYEEYERAAFEVYVKDGRLYNSSDSLVDTSDADQGHDGPAAIFIMAPDGKIFLSNHQGSIHTSSFLAGNPVSGAGEIVVEDGVVRKIIACSERYKPDLELNKQVIQSLVTQGYTDPIVSEMCPA